MLGLSELMDFCCTIYHVLTFTSIHTPFSHLRRRRRRRRRPTAVVQGKERESISFGGKSGMRFRVRRPPSPWPPPPPPLHLLASARHRNRPPSRRIHAANSGDSQGFGFSSLHPLSVDLTSHCHSSDKERFQLRILFARQR